MYTLPHQLEFGTEAWLDEARAFLERRLIGGPDESLGPFSIGLRLTATPDHLDAPDGVTSCRLAWDGEKVSATRGGDDPSPAEPDVAIEGDYQAAVTAAQFVGVADPEGAAWFEREVRHRFGPEQLRARGQLDPNIRRLLAGLHDHLGRRTVENPDLLRRAESLGIAERIRELDEQGFTVLERAIPDDFADELRDTTLRVLADHGTDVLQWMLYQGRCFERLAQHPELSTLLDASLGRGAVIASLSAIRRGPGPGFIPLHTDYSLVPEPYPEWAVTGVGVWALEDWTEASGPTWVVPGSHRLRRGPRREEIAAGVEGGVPIEMPKGSVVFFTEGLWHWQGDRTEPGERVTLHWHYNRGIMRSLEPKRTDTQLLHRNAPRLGEMLGTDDWFDKMDGIGRDHLRMAHMNRLQAFTTRRLEQLLAPGEG